MPSRSQKMIRRDTNRLSALIDEHAPVHAELAAIQTDVTDAATNVNGKWRAYQAAAIASSKETGERDTVVAALLKWSRSWRGVVAIKIKGAAANIHEIPANGATPDDVAQQANDIKEIIVTNPAAEPFRENALAQLGTKIEDAKRETAEASIAVPAKQKAADEFAHATLEANTLLVEGSKVIRNIFGEKSREYKQLIKRANTKEEAKDDADEDEGDDEDTDVTDANGTDTDEDNAGT